jgi:hypothetical protein
VKWKLAQPRIPPRTEVEENGNVGRLRMGRRPAGVKRSPGARYGGRAIAISVKCTRKGRPYSIRYTPDFLYGAGLTLHKRHVIVAQGRLLPLFSVASSFVLSLIRPGQRR